MTQTSLNLTRHYSPNTYGGEVYQNDFNTSIYGNRNIAERILRDQLFDEKCKKYIENRGKLKNDR